MRPVSPSFTASLLLESVYHELIYMKDGMTLMHPWMNDVNDEGTSEKISEFQVGIEPMNSVTPIGCSNH